MSVSLQEFKREILPGGRIDQAEATEVLVYVCRVKTTFIRLLDNKEPDPLKDKILSMSKKEVLLRLPADESDITGIVALVSSGAARRKKNQRDSQRRKAKP